MSHTPAEARELWCPMARIARHEVTEVETARTSGDPPLIAMRTDHHIVGGCNTDALGRTRVPASCRCIADQCAMWRWAPSTTSHPERRIQDLGNGFKKEVVVSVPDARGYCGLAGRPELL